MTRPKKPKVWTHSKKYYAMRELLALSLESSDVTAEDSAKEKLQKLLESKDANTVAGLKSEDVFDVIDTACAMLRDTKHSVYMAAKIGQLKEEVSYLKSLIKRIAKYYHGLDSTINFARAEVLKK